MSTALIEKLTSFEKTVNTRIDGLESQVKTTAAQRKTGAVPAGAPSVRKGANIMGSDGFSYAKLMLATAHPGEDWARDNAKIEMEFSSRMVKNLHKQGWHPDRASGRIAPLWPEAFNEEILTQQDYNEMKSMLGAGIEGNDPDEMVWLAKRYLGYGQKATVSSPVAPSTSWIDQSIMGSFVPPPTFGPPIELLRNREVMMSAGCTVYPLGPSGRLIMPRLTSATQGGWAGENQQQAPINPGTGQLLLSAKKVIALVVMPNELLRFASPAAEQLIRNDLFKTVALIADKGFLDGQGSDNVPLGLATMGAAGAAAPAAGTFSPSTFGVNVIGPTNANQLAPQDVYTFLAAIEEANGEATSWIMRPSMFYAFAKARWTPYSTGTSQGAFTFDLTRGLDFYAGKAISGLKVVTSPQVSNTRGSGAQTYVIAFDAADYIMGMFGAIEFTQTDAGFTLLSSDQTAVRAILTCDGGQRHPGLVAFCDALNLVVAG